MPPGQETGHAVPAVPADPARGFAWSDYVDWLVADRGTLTAVAEELVARQGFAADVESAERGLRRLRKRNAGGVWGERCLRAFGLPTPVADRIRWMGHYHSRFTDLPVSLGEELLRPWLRPPTSESPARVWLLLAQANLAIRRRGDPSPHLDQAALVPNPPDAAACELALVRAYHLERRDPAAATAALDAAEAALPADGPDRACLVARLIDQRAYRLNKPRTGAPDHAAAAALYASIPADGPLFAQVRRGNGLGWSLLRMGRPDAAEEHARAALRAAGDLGSLRLRAMSLNLLAAVRDDPAIRARASAIAARLEDEALAVRFRA